jgi:chaperonin cofactor prefoldin
MDDVLASAHEPTSGSPEPADVAGDSTPPAAEVGSLAEPLASTLLATPAVDKKRLEEQLEALKRKELELRRALAIANHPELADAIRLLDGRTYALTRVEAKIALGLSKSEERRKETLEKKLEALNAKSSELKAQITELSAELDLLVKARADALEGERRAALNELVAALGQHNAAVSAAGLDVSELVPEIGQRMAQIRAAAEDLVAASKDSPAG